MHNIPVLYSYLYDIWVIIWHAIDLTYVKQPNNELSNEYHYGYSTIQHGEITRLIRNINYLPFANTWVCPALFRLFVGSVLLVFFSFSFSCCVCYFVCLSSVYRAQSLLCFWIVHFWLALRLSLTFNYRTHQIKGIYVDFKIRVLERFMDT